MITRPLTDEDLNRIRFLHSRYYKDEFPFPDFRTFATTFKVLNDDGEIITAGGIKYNPEIILVTDQSINSANRAFALTAALQIAQYFISSHGHNLLYASVVNGSKWHEQLINYGFRDSVGKHLVIG